MKGNHIRLLFLVLVFGAATVVGLGATQPEQFSGWRKITVASGQSEWQIAIRAVPDANPVEAVAAIQRRNRIGAVLQAGQCIWIPTKVSG